MTVTPVPPAHVVEALAGALIRNTLERREHSRAATSPTARRQGASRPRRGRPRARVRLLRRLRLGLPASSAHVHTAQAARLHGQRRTWGCRPHAYRCRSRPPRTLPPSAAQGVLAQAAAPVNSSGSLRAAYEGRAACGRRTARWRPGFGGHACGVGAKETWAQAAQHHPLPGAARCAIVHWATTGTVVAQAALLGRRSRPCLGLGGVLPLCTAAIANSRQ